MAQNLSKILLVFVGIILIMANNSIQCPSNCRCLPNDFVTCILHMPVDYKAFGQLSDKTITLKLVIKDSFREELADFNNLSVLENLEFTANRQYTSYQKALGNHALNSFKRHDLFQNLTNLRSLSINLVLKSFNWVLLTPLHRLKSLSFSHTYMFHFNDFINIVNVTGTHLLRVNEFRMIAFQRVITPDSILRLKEHIYEGLQNLKLKVLDLSRNKAVLLQQGLPMYFPYLEVFRVGATELMMFEKTPYSPICYLAGICMHANLREFELLFPERTTVTLDSTYSLGDLNTGSEDADRLLYCIQHLYISSNMCELGNCLCDGLTELPCQPYAKEIHIGDIIAPPEKGQPLTMCFPPPPSLETFVLWNYQSFFITHATALCFTAPKWSNVVRYVDVTSNDLSAEFSPKFSITGLPQLRFFSLQGNQIVFSNETSMSDLTSLEVLLLGNNNISSLSHSDIDFLNLGNLTVLDLENCNIHHMQLDSLAMLRKLEILNLSRNTLRDFQVNITHLGHLKLLNLSNNDISTFGEGFRRQLETLNTSVDISGNPLTCFCDNIDFVQWLQSDPRRFVKKNDTKCLHPTLQSISPWEVDISALYRHCIHFDAIISSVCSAAGMALVITAIFVVYRRRWRIRYWLYAAKENWRRRMEQGEGRPLLAQEYIYDAFVAYSSHGEERSWVHTTLREKLENEHGLKLCMYHRDFKVGRDLAETIVEGINSSNKTLLILSPNFLNSGWCEFEVRMANEKVISERRDSLVIVIFKRLDEAGTRLPKMLARLMEKKIYIEWTDDPDGQKLFWRRLVDSIKGGTNYDAFGDLCDMNG